MIKRITDFTGISDGLPPLMPVIKTDFQFACTDVDGVYCQEENGEKTLLVSLRGVTATVVRLSDNANTEELISFLNFHQMKNVLSDFCFDATGLEKRAVMKAVTDCAFSENATILTPASRLWDYENVFNLLSKNGEFEAWYPLFSRKVNNSCACGVYISENSTTVSCALAPFVCGDTGIIAGVYTDEKYRKKGFATKCVKSLVAELKNKNVETAYLWCEDKNIKFYENAGFSVCGEIHVKKEE